MEVVLFVSYLLLGVMCCLTNGFLVFIIFAKAKLHTVTNIIIVSLAISDLFVGAIVSSLEAAHYVGEFSFHPQDYGCLVLEMFQNFIPLVSIFHLMLVAVERYMNIAHPLNYHRFATTRKVTAMLVTCWTIPLLFSMVPSLGWNNVNEFDSPSNETMECQQFDTLSCSYLGLMFSLIAMIYITMVTMYGKIFSIAWHQAKRVQATNQQTFGHRKHFGSRSEFKAVIILAVTVGYFFVSWFPLGWVIGDHCMGGQASETTWSIAFFLAYMNSTVNPLIYGIGNRGIRTTMMKYLKIERREEMVSAITFIEPVD